MAEKMSRGMRNFNPFNIKKGRSKWLGMKPASSTTDSVFVQFSSMELGVRAGLILLANYIRRGYNTPSLIISRYAPSSENNVNKYLNYLDLFGFAPDYKFPSAIFAYDPSFCDFIDFARLIASYESNYEVSRSELIHIVRKYHLFI